MGFKMIIVWLLLFTVITDTHKSKMNYFISSDQTTAITLFYLVWKSDFVQTKSIYQAK